ncbi:MAG TPA: hypothetical protein VEY95_04425 [Azospirillaceae bacterium]|nr:hypothetical protein [Azospirillaceae bacterium]
MSNAFVIEAAGEAAGVVVREERGYRFYAAARPFFPLEAQAFRRPEDASRAAERLVAARGNANRPQV